MAQAAQSMDRMETLPDQTHSWPRSATTVDPLRRSRPLPGSPAICAGIVADIPTGVSTDQRGLPRTTTYLANPPCVDSGPVQTNYSLAFSTEPPSTIPANSNFTAAVQVKESGNPFPISGIDISLRWPRRNNGALNVSSLSTNSSGIATTASFDPAPGRTISWPPPCH